MQYEYCDDRGSASVPRDSCKTALESGNKNSYRYCIYYSTIIWSDHRGTSPREEIETRDAFKTDPLLILSQVRTLAGTFLQSNHANCQCPPLSLYHRIQRCISSPRQLVNWFGNEATWLGTLHKFIYLNAFSFSFVRFSFFIVCNGIKRI